MVADVFVTIAPRKSADMSWIVRLCPLRSMTVPFERLIVPKAVQSQSAARCTTLLPEPCVSWSNRCAAPPLTEKENGTFVPPTSMLPEPKPPNVSPQTTVKRCQPGVTS